MKMVDFLNSDTFPFTSRQPGRRSRAFGETRFSKMLRVPAPIAVIPDNGLLSGIRVFEEPDTEFRSPRRRCNCGTTGRRIRIAVVRTCRHRSKLDVYLYLSVLRSNSAMLT